MLKVYHTNKKDNYAKTMCDFFINIALVLSILLGTWQMLNYSLYLISNTFIEYVLCTRHCSKHFS